MSGTSASDWNKLEAYALEHGALDAIDRVLIRTLAAKARCDGDLAFHVVLACLVSAVRAGGLRIPIAGRGLEARLEEWLRGLYAAAKRAGADDPDPETFPEPRGLALRMAEDFTASRLDDKYAAVLGRVDPASGRADPFLPLIHAGEGLYFQRHHAAEALAGARLRRLLDAADLAFPAREVERTLQAVLVERPLRTGNSPGAPAMVFAGAQRAAIEMALRKRFTVVSGGPGTGKTALAANLLRAWVRLWARTTPRPPRIRLAAPTGRAAQRLSESIKRGLGTLGEFDRSASDPDAEADAFVKGLSGGTLHSLLRYQPATGDFFHHAHRPLPADLVLVDEVSMVDIFLLARLLDALEEGACLVLMGDMDQLPSVEAGSVLADLAPVGAGDHPLRDHLAILDRSHRSDAGILEVTRGINAMDADAALAAMAPPLLLASAAWPTAFREAGRTVCPGGGCRFVIPRGALPEGDPGRGGLENLLDAWIDFHYLGNPFDPTRHPGRELAAPRRASFAEAIAALGALPETGDEVVDARLEPLLAEAFAYLDQARILTFTRIGWHGSVALNRRIGEKLRRRWDPRSEGPSAGGGQMAVGFPGAPILIAENDPARGLFNGDVGLHLRIGGRDLAWFRRSEGFQSHPVPFLPRHELAFAMTVHKAQGSEYDQVLLVLPEAGNRLLFKETLYTALTRARHFAGIYGSEGVFREAIGRKVIRDSGLAAYLAAAPGPDQA